MGSLQRTLINAPRAPQPIGLYSQAIRIRAAEFVFIAGQVAIDRQGKLVGKGDVSAQTRQIFENIGAILESMGASFSNVAEFTTYVVGRAAVKPFMQTRSEIFPALFPNRDYPPNTLLVVAGLVSEDYLVEIKATAAVA
jgi:enamine deaminase RidA (YjgF/YER057c/UK114 family)